jgi:hypothetical protein
VSPVPAAKPACDHLAVEGRRLSRDRTARDGLLITGSVLGVATIATYFLWPARPNRSSGIALDLGTDRRGLMLYGQF